MSDSTTRFSNRVEDYVKYRPHYPIAVVDYLQQQGALPIGASIADIGSGTGISSMLFLNKGFFIKGVEPNKEMREKSEELLKDFPDFEAIDGTAEHTTLPDKSVDTVVAGQAFHWFNRNETRKEFERVLKPNGSVVLIWNERLIDTEFEKNYEALIEKFGRQYKKVDHRNIDYKAIQDFFEPNEVRYEVFNNQQVFDYEGLEGRLLSSSYMPTRADADFKNMITELKQLFDQYNEAGVIAVHYATKVYLSCL